MKIFIFVLLLSTVSSFGFAKDNKITQSQAVLVELRDPVGDETERVIRVKEVESGKVTQLTLEKDPVTPQAWSGYFAIQFLVGDGSLRTLDFINGQGESFFASISQQKSVQKVVLFKTIDELTLYEMGTGEGKPKPTEETAKTSENPVAKLSEKKIQLVPKNTTGPINPEQMGQLVRQQGRLQEATQVSLEESEAKQRMALIEEQQKLSEEQRAKEKAEAADLVQKADEAYGKRKFKESAGLYGKATKLDPTNESYYYRYGVSLYKVGNYNKSLAIMSLAEVNSEQALEKDYYIALNHMKLKDYEKARKEFIEIREENSPELSPISSFLAGTMEFQQQKYPEARKSMEYVIDNSKDPKLDKSAENMMEQIDRMEALYESQRERYRLSFFSGLVYDSNVLNVAENNISTDVKAWRLQYGASALAFLYREPGMDLGAAISFSDYYSLDSSFRGDATLQAADAMELGLSLPYHQQLKAGKKSLNLEVLPSYKNILMSVSGGTRSVVVRSAGVATTLAAPVKSDIFLSGRLDLGQDESLLATSVGDSDLSGTHYGLTVTPVKVLDVKGDYLLLGELSYTANNTNGKDNRSKRTALASSFSFPAYFKGQGSVRGDYSLQDYAEASTPRKDTVFLLTGSYTKNLTKQWNFLLSAQFTNANSEVDSYKYNKYAISSLFTYTTSILK
jgi:TolA-binding protein